MSLRLASKIESLAVSTGEKTLQFNAQCLVTNETQSIAKVIAHPDGKHPAV